MNCKICGKIIKDEFQKCNSIGYGSYATINLVCNSEKPKYILKNFFDKDDSELNICEKINCIEDVFLSKYITTINNNSIIYQYIEGDTLGNFIYGQFDSNFLNIIKSLVDQLYILERQNYYHLDINLNNIIVKDNKPYLIDFGTLTNKNDFIKKECYGSYGYIAPEFLFEKELVIDKFDVFSIGIIIFQKLCGFNPFNMSKYYRLKCWFWCKDCSFEDRGKCLFNYMDKNAKFKNNKLFNIIINCIEYDPCKRYSLSKLKKELSEVNY